MVPSKWNYLTLKPNLTITIQSPHDGPIFHYKQGDDKGSISIAFQLLNDKLTDILTSNLAAKSCKVLQLQKGNSKHSSQINALCWTWRRKIKIYCHCQMKHPANDWLYSLLVDGSLSSQITVPLQRAIQSNLKTIDTGINKQALASLWRQSQC
jgi:hypothetical protein